MRKRTLGVGIFLISLLFQNHLPEIRLATCVCIVENYHQRNCHLWCKDHCKADWNLLNLGRNTVYLNI